MFPDFLHLFRSSISSSEFERSVFNIVSRHVADKRSLRDELAAIENLEKILPESERRYKAAAELYLLLERNIAEEQTKGRIPRETLRGEILAHCHPERARGDFALMFLPHYERQTALFQRFAEMVLARANTLMGQEKYAAFMDALSKDPVIGKEVKGGAIGWKQIEKETEPYTPPVRRDMVQKFLTRLTRVLAGTMVVHMGELRTEMMFQEVYRRYHDPIDFVEDVPKVLLVVPQDFLEDERIALMGKTELETKLREKSKALETKLSTLSREELEKEVTKRTVELETALQAAEDARKNLEEFSSLATHELRTPIAAVKGYLNLLMTDKHARPTETQEKYLKLAARANERLLTLVGAMLNVSRVELGTLAIEPALTYLPDVAERVCTDLAMVVKEKNQKIVKNYDRTVPLIEVDPSLTRTIFENLISNAIKYTPEKGTITVGIVKKEPNVLVTVKDTGYGISEAEQPRIFEKLFRAANARTRVAEGTGLGLYLVKSILDETGGKIWFESEENKGTAFYVSIPLSGMARREGVKGLS